MNTWEHFTSIPPASWDRTAKLTYTITYHHDAAVVRIFVGPVGGDASEFTEGGMLWAERTTWVAAMELAIAFVRRLPGGHLCEFPVVAVDTGRKGATATVTVKHDGDEAALRALHEAVDKPGAWAP